MFRSSKTAVVACGVVAACALVAGCSEQATESAATSSAAAVLAPMTSVSVDDLAAERADSQVVGPNSDVELPTSARKIECQHFAVNSDGTVQQPIDRGPVNFVALDESFSKGPQVTFYLNDFLPADFTATVVEIAGSPTDESTAQDQQNPAVRRLIVQDAQQRANYLKKGTQNLTIVGDFYTLSPDQGRVALVIPNQQSELFTFDQHTVAAFISGEQMSRCSMKQTPAAEPQPKEEGQEQPAQPPAEAAEQEPAQDSPQDQSDQQHDDQGGDPQPAADEATNGEGS
ncbi:hypothetical protein [Corynebacterium aquilae]|uniref:hypothetical protein n=1 Tax=Corynebacterium aquilae TaxID=203263 RepID=UPI0012ED0CC3|nr:hypothetical protein [Corynebacterium aquilae]